MSQDLTEQGIHELIGRAVREPEFAEELELAKTADEFIDVLARQGFGPLSANQVTMIRENLPTLRDAAATLDMSKIRIIS